MSDVIDRPILAEEAAAKSRFRIIDCDVHPSIHAHADLEQFMPKRWQEHLRTYGSHLRTPYIGTTPYPRSSPLIARRDAWPPTGGPPGSDLDFMRKQHLDPLDVEFGILQVLDLFIFSQQNLEFGAAIQRAINDWQLAFWSDREPRLKASILAGQDDTQLAIAEIERCAKIGRYVQINVCPRANEPLGRRRYWPIYERAQELGLPLGIHVGGYGGHAPTGGGWPSYYVEEHQSTRTPWRRSSPASCSKAFPNVSRTSRSSSSKAVLAGSRRRRGGWTGISTPSAARCRISSGGRRNM